MDNPTAMTPFLRHECLHRDSNSGFSLERAASWSPRRWRQRTRFYHILPGGQGFFRAISTNLPANLKKTDQGNQTEDNNDHARDAIDPDQASGIKFLTKNTHNSRQA